MENLIANDSLWHMIVLIFVTVLVIWIIDSALLGKKTQHNTWDLKHDQIEFIISSLGSWLLKQSLFKKNHGFQELGFDKQDVVDIINYLRDQELIYFDTKDNTNYPLVDNDEIRNLLHVFVYPRNEY